MKTVQQRIEEFCIYHRDGDGECNNVVLKAWAKKHCNNMQELYELSYFFAITYCVESAIVLFNERKKVFSDITGWVAENKRSLVFQSDRKYIRMRNSFERCLESFKAGDDVDQFLQKITENGIIILGKAVPYVSSWEMFGRFSAYLFLETFVELTRYPIENEKMNWHKNTTATSGLLNVFGLDNSANNWDKYKKLSVTVEKLDEMLNVLQEHIGMTGGSTNVTEIETSLCAYRKFYKGSRYNGYYLDRMLEEIYTMQNDYPEISSELFEIRKQHFKPQYLGELSGWKKVRPNMKKVYKEMGIIT